MIKIFLMNNVCNLNSFIRAQKNVDFIRLRLLWYRQTPCNHIYDLAHADRREHPGLNSWLFL